MCRVDEADWARLARTVSGPVRRPGDTGYREYSTPFNTRYAGTTPVGVVSVRSVADIQHAISWARDVNVPIVARGGGHSYGGYSVNTGLVIDLSPMNTVTADADSGIV